MVRKISINSKCPCGSNIKYKKCCKPFHDGKLAPNGLILMKSRYSAYALNKYQYIINTTHKNNQDFTPDIVNLIQSIKVFSKQTKFTKLIILDFKDGDIESYVTFKAELFSNRDIPRNTSTCKSFT